MEEFFRDFFIGAAGSGAFELLKLYQLRGKLDARTYHSLLRKGWYWTIVIGFLAASGFIAWAYNSGKPVTPWELVITGVAARSLAREGSAALVASKAPTLGAAPVEGATLRDALL
jgi:hypothetical protein